MGNGKLISPTKLEVTAADGSKQTVEAKNIIIATGARARELPALKLDGKKVIEYRVAMTLGLLAGWDLDEINQRANAVAAHVASRAGATPELPEYLRAPFLPALLGSRVVT